MSSIATRKTYKTARVYERTHESLIKLQDCLFHRYGHDLSMVEVLDIAVINELERREDPAENVNQSLTEQELKDAYAERAAREREAAEEDQRIEAVAQYV